MKSDALNSDLTEKAWDAQLFSSKDGLAPMCGWFSYHTLRSKGSQPGFPDRVVTRERIVYAELKTGSKLSVTQRAWLDRLSKAGGECYVWLPDDLDEIGLILGKRWTFAASLGGRGPLCSGADPAFQPRSLWLFGQGRVDGRTV